MRTNHQRDTQQTIATLELDFDSDLDRPMESCLMGHPERDMPFCVRDVEVTVAVPNDHGGATTGSSAATHDVERGGDLREPSHPQDHHLRATGHDRLPGTPSRAPFNHRSRRPLRRAVFRLTTQVPAPDDPPITHPHPERPTRSIPIETYGHEHETYPRHPSDMG
jgi:hypothetical protein